MTPDNHSLEPWTVHASFDGPVVIQDADGREICGYSSSFGSGRNIAVLSTVTDLTRIAAAINFVQDLPTSTLTSTTLSEYIQSFADSLVRELYENLVKGGGPGVTAEELEGGEGEADAPLAK